MCWEKLLKSKQLKFKIFSDVLLAVIDPLTVVKFKFLIKACGRYFLSNFCFYEMIGLQKLWKMFFISSKKLFSFLRYSNFLLFFPSFPHFPDSIGQMEVE